MSQKHNTRASAAQITWQIIDRGQSLDAALNHYFEQRETSTQDRGFTQELVYGVCRWYGELDAIASQLLRSPIRRKDRIVHYVLLIGLYQLHHLDTAQHAGVSETVSACQQLNKGWAKNLINGCLRAYLRNAATGDVDKKFNAQYKNINRITHPDWIVSAIEQAWPNHLEVILEANNQRPPMCLRVNSVQGSRDSYLERLKEAKIECNADQYSDDGIVLQQAVPVSALPDFFTGAVSVQDTAAQLACDILQVEQGQAILDACSAPGGKTAHILERTGGNINMTALDVSQPRCEQLHNTLDRLNLQATIVAADATQAPTWATPKDGYDRILIDAPCSGLGVIRRHPDIKHHRQLSDIEPLKKIQQALLSNLWPTLKPGGLLLYMTCSILPSENELQISQFLDSQNDAMLETINHPNALKLPFGVQTLPGLQGMDGFYYSLITKVI